MGAEMDILKDIQIKASELGWRAFRVNVGSGWIGDSMRCKDGSVLIKNARRFQTGLPNGFPDLLIIGPQGQTVYAEIKTPNGKMRIEQLRFHQFLKRMNQRVCVLRSVDDLIKIVEGYKNV